MISQERDDKQITTQPKFTLKNYGKQSFPASFTLPQTGFLRSDGHWFRKSHQNRFHSILEICILRLANKSINSTACHPIAPQFHPSVKHVQTSQFPGKLPHRFRNFHRQSIPFHFPNHFTPILTIFDSDFTRVFKNTVRLQIVKARPPCHGGLKKK